MYVHCYCYCSLASLLCYSVPFLSKSSTFILIRIPFSKLLILLISFRKLLKDKNLYFLVLHKYSFDKRSLEKYHSLSIFLRAKNGNCKQSVKEASTWFQISFMCILSSSVLQKKHSCVFDKQKVCSSLFR